MTSCRVYKKTCRIVFSFCGILLLTSTLPASTAVAADPGTIWNLLSEDQTEQAWQGFGQIIDEDPYLYVGGSTVRSELTGAFSRELQQLSPEERFESLKNWTLPATSPPLIRHWATFVPVASPPKEFARVLGERPRDSSFALPQPAGVEGFFSSAFELASTAQELGLMRTLLAELADLEKKSAPNARAVRLICEIHSGRFTATTLLEELTAECETRLKTSLEKSEPNLCLDPMLFSLIVSCLEDESLLPFAREWSAKLEQATRGNDGRVLRPWTRCLLAHASQPQGSTSQGVAGSPHWIPVSLQTAHSHALGLPQGDWRETEGHLLHWTGGQKDLLMFRYPLQGDFEFTCQTQFSGAAGSDGALQYGGLFYFGVGVPVQSVVLGGSDLLRVQRSCPFIRSDLETDFTRVSIQVKNGQARYLVNGHPMWQDPIAQTSPWLALGSMGARRPVFRNLQFSKAPTIPRQVALLDQHSTEVRGWQPYFNHETLPSFQLLLAPEHPAPLPNPDEKQFAWFMKDGELTAQTTTGPANQSLLQYQRPLLENESFSYEFFHEGDQVSIHPALGKLVLQLESPGVKIHWVTDQTRDWTLLPADNSTLEPLNRRGPRPLPLKNNDWNQVTLSWQQEKLQLQLNGTLIYTRPLDFTGDRLCGFYRMSDQPAPRIRNAILSGDWPEQLPDQLLSTSLTQRSESDSANLLPEGLADHNGPGILRSLDQVEPHEKFTGLLNWVLPEQASLPVRLGGWLAPTDPSPVMRDSSPEFFSSAEGGDFLSVASNLLQLAQSAEQQRLILTRIEQRFNSAAPDLSPEFLALATVLFLKYEQQEPAAKCSQQFFDYINQNSPQDAPELWPELFLLQSWLHDPQLAPGPQSPETAASSVLHETLMMCVDQHAARRLPANTDPYLAHLLRLKYRYLNLRAGYQPDQDLFQEWIPVSREKASSRGQGFPRAQWQLSPQDSRIWQHVCGHQEDYLLYHQPLTGDFEITGDLGSSTSANLFAFNQIISPTGTVGNLIVGTFSIGSKVIPFDPPFAAFRPPWHRLHIRNHDEIQTIRFNDRTVTSQQTTDAHQPWFGFRAWWPSTSEIRHIQITGNPVIPEGVRLDSDPLLQNWLSYYDESLGQTTSGWYTSRTENEPVTLIANKYQGAFGTYSESLLRYIRPLTRGCSVEYEFWYETGKVDAHPALDRMVLFTTPTGVLLHWLTDSHHERTAVDPANATPVSNSPVSLKEADWNQARLTLKDQQAILEINGTTVCEIPLDERKFYPFGLFHYRDQTELRVRKILLHGNWPQKLSSPESQQLANPLVIQLNKEASQFEDTFALQFNSQSDFSSYVDFKGAPNGETTAKITSRGIQIRQRGTGAWTSPRITFPFTISGDFDLTAQYSDLVLDAEKQAFISVSLLCDDEHRQLLRSLRVFDQRQQIRTSTSSFPEGTPKRIFREEGWPSESESGRLRICRRGDQVHFLAAAADSQNYELLETRTCTTADVVLKGIELRSVVNGEGVTEVCWNSIEIKSDQLRYLPADLTEQRVIALVDTETGVMQKVTSLPEGFGSLGSPEYSFDGKTILFDAANGSVATAHLFTVQTDGTNLKDLGPGCMPSLAPDGKQLVCTVSGSGIVLIDLVSGEREVLDASGWGAQWSPDGNTISYGLSGNIALYDVRTRKIRLLLSGEDAQRYSYIYWNHGWSHDHRSIAFKGRVTADNSYEVSVCDLAPDSKMEILYASEKETYADFTFTPDNRRILFSMNTPQLGKMRLYTVDRSQPGMPELFTPQPDDLSILDADWSPIARQIAIAAVIPPTPQDWITPQPVAPTNPQ
ncbi:MAG: DUF1583 domain-containing protein [Planctomycetaceae bacterium]|nr:DUF1583 domain-containing protein [Planctomycetaceae bacterium]